jgi:hypothetical protein
MSLLSVAQGSTGYLVACDFETSSTQNTSAAGYTVSSTAYGTITQNSSSLTGSYSYVFGANSNVLHQWGGTSSNSANQIFEIVFKRSSTPASAVTLMSSPGNSIYGDTYALYLTAGGTLFGYAASRFSSRQVDSTTNLCDGNFHHVILSYNADAGYFRLYVDGVLVDSDTSIGSIGG